MTEVLVHLPLKLAIGLPRDAPVDHLGTKLILPCPFCVKIDPHLPDDQGQLSLLGWRLLSLSANLLFRGTQSNHESPET